MDDKLVSICVPAYEMKGKGSEYIEFLFNSLYNQTYKNIEIIVSDHSKNDMIEQSCKLWSDRLNIKHYYNDIGRGLFPSNMNNAIKKAKGDIIKLLCQDDFLFDSHSLETQLIHLLGNHNHWLITACCHTKDGINFYNPIYPKYHDNIHYGENTISSPSVIMFRNEDIINFDENLFWLVDVEWYKRLYDKFGLPSICNYITVVNREDDSTRVSSNLVSDEVRNKELEYVIKKYKQ
jgi:glycosyltransferase involved in cell wall biosynthesis